MNQPAGHQYDDRVALQRGLMSIATRVRDSEDQALLVDAACLRSCASI